MAQRSKSWLKHTPDYVFHGLPDCLAIKLYYNGSMESALDYKEYIGGNVDYFDFADKDKLGMLELWGYAEEVGCKDKKSIKFWHKFGETLENGKYLENDADAMDIRNHIPNNYEVEIYIEHNDGTSNEMGIRSTLEKDVDSIDDEYVDEFGDSDCDFDEDDRLFDAFVDDDVEFSKGKDVIGDVHISDELLYMMQQDEGDDDCVESDELGSPLNSDNDEFQKFPMFDPNRDSKNPELKIGLIFNSKKEAKFAIESHCIRKGMTVRFIKNDGKRLRAQCKNEGCGWLIHVSVMSNDSCWQVKTFERNHNSCCWNRTNKCINSSWLGKTFVKKFTANPKLGTIEFRDEVCETLQVDISRKVAYLAKRKALSLVEGSVDEQYSRIRNYCTELKRTDKDATVILKLTDDEGAPRFQRMYVCFSACKFGFKDACRPVIGVDGCFLKSKTGGQLLSAVGLDPNNNIFPICYALVEGETKDTWMWFLQLLDGDINLDDQYAWTFMSDKQKGLIPALESLFPNAEHKFCVRHLHSNMKNDGFRSVAIKNALWAAARATRIEHFHRRMQELKEIDQDAYEWLAKNPENHWAKSHFSTIPKCDILLNNMCECFNSLILDAREKPIIQMFEAIRQLLMLRFQLNREKAYKWDTRNCPRIRAALAKISLEAAKQIPMKLDDMHFQVRRANSQEQYIVDLLQKSCSCRKWDLTGIPCKHACCALWSKKEDPENYVSHYYMTETYKKCYSRSIMPINGVDLWPVCELPPPMPPIYKKNKAGRPAKLRRREHDEPPASSQTKLKGPRRYNKCKICGGLGHNQRSCKEGQNIQQEANSQQSSVMPNEAGASLSDNAQHTDDNSILNIMEKIQVRRSHTIGVQIGGSSNTISTVNVNQSSIIKKPVFVKGGMNFTTLSSLRSTSRDRKRQVQSMSQPVAPVSKLSHGPNISKEKGVTTSQSSVSKK